MSAQFRTTQALLRVVEIFLDAHEKGTELHGWAIKQEASLSGAGTYRMLDRLEDAGWITGSWEERNPELGKPPRRLYHLTPIGEPAMRVLLVTRKAQKPLRGTPQSAPGYMTNSILRLLRVGPRVFGSAR